MVKNKINRTKTRCMGCMREYDEITKEGYQVIICPHCGYLKDTPAKEAYHLPPGTILQGKYIVGRVLGYGGFGVTYVGFDAQLERKIAIKEYLPTNFSTRMPGQTKLSVYDGENGEQFRAGLSSFVEEAKRLSKLNSLPGTVDIFDSFLQNETGYIVMEYLEGKTVKETLIEKGVFEYATAKIIILKILDTLKEVHKEGIIHRDIAPDNIFLLGGDDVRIIDFCASRYATTLHSKSLSVILKPGYAPEEQYRSRGMQGSWSDVYALAATFYRMITGITPEESMERMMNDELKEPSKIGVKLSQNDENAIMNALLVKASDRTQSAEEFARQLTADDEVSRAVSTIKKYDAGKVPKWARMLAASLCVVIVAFALLLITGALDLRSGAFVSALSGEERLARNETRVPNVIGEQVFEAGVIASEAELLLVISNKEFNDKVETDKVMLQTPLSGRVQLKNSALNVVVSGGVETSIEAGVMPDIVFRTMEEAIAMLEAAGIAYELVYEESDTIARDGVISSSIRSGELVGDDATVIIVISEGSDRQDRAIENAQEVFHRVTFLDWNGTVLSTQNIKNENRAGAPSNPVRYGYQFVSWDRDFSTVTSDITVRAVYSKLPEYTVMFEVDGVVWNRQVVPEGESAYRPADPEKTGFDFGGWTPSSPGLNNIRSNMTKTASWNPVPTYTVTFQDWDGKVISTQTVNRGDSATAPPHPNSRSGYEPSVSQWLPGFSNVRQNLVVVAQYAKIPEYTVTFKCGLCDQNNGSPQIVMRGDNAIAPTTCNHSNYLGEAYEFTGWSSTFTNVQGNMTVTAQFAPIPKYTVLFMCGLCEQTLSSQTILRGGNASTPTMHNHASYLGEAYDPGVWNRVVPVANVQGNITVTANYTLVPKYTVRFLDWNSQVLKSETILRGSTATAPSNPSRYGYTFISWDRAVPVTNVQANIDVRALYDRIVMYSYRDIVTTTNTTGQAPSGTELVSSTEFIEWGGWSGWSTAYPNPGASKTRQIESRSVDDFGTRTIYQWLHWRFWNPWGSPNYFPRDMRGYSGYSYICGVHTCETTYMLPLAQNTDMGSMYGPHSVSFCAGVYWFSNGQRQETYRTGSHMEYRYRDGAVKYEVKYWGAWSSYSTTPVTATSTRQVRTKFMDE